MVGLLSLRGDFQSKKASEEHRDGTSDKRKNKDDEEETMLLMNSSLMLVMKTVISKREVAQFVFRVCQDWKIYVPIIMLAKRAGEFGQHV